MLTEILKNSLGYSVTSEVTKDVTADRVSVSLYVKTPENEVLSVHTIPRTNVLRNKQAFAFLLDSTAFFNQDEVEEIQTKVRNLLNSVEKNTVNTVNSKIPIQDVYYDLSEFCLNNAINLDEIRSKAELQKESSRGIFRKGDYILVKPEKLQEYVIKNKCNEYSRLEILRWLKMQGLLDVGNGREYDKQVSIDNVKHRVYKIKICEHKTNDEEVETIELNLTEPEETQEELKVGPPKEVKFATDAVVMPFQTSVGNSNSVVTSPTELQ
jgi:hypothetical protein